MVQEFNSKFDCFGLERVIIAPGTNELTYMSKMLHIMI